MYRFSGFSADPVRRLLFGPDGQAIALKPRVFDALLYFIEHRGELLEKQTLLDAIWPNVVVEENNLNQAISTLRRIFGETRDDHRFIVTEPGRGYRFVALVESVGEASGSTIITEPRPASSLPQRSSGWAMPPRSRRSLSTAPLLSIAFALAVVALAVAAELLRQDARVAPSERRPTFALLDVRPADRLYGSLASQRPARTAVRLSPNGRTLIFAGVRDGVYQLFKRRLDEQQATAIPGTGHASVPERANVPFFSPDGEWLAFWQEGRFKRLPLAGGPPVDIGAVHGGADVGPMGASWGTDGRIVYAMPELDGIWSIYIDGGEPERVTQVDRDRNENHRLPHVLPDGRAMVFTVTGPRGDDRARLMTHRFDTAEERLLIEDAADARYLSSGHLLFMRRGTLMAAPFDAERLEVTGNPVVVFDNIMQAINQRNTVDETFAGQFDASNGTLVVVPGGVLPPAEHQLVWVSREGAETPFTLAPGPLHGPRWSPNGKFVTYFTANTGGATADIWVYDVNRRTSRRLFLDGEWPLWSADSSRLVFRGRAGGLRSIGVNDSGTPPLEIPHTVGATPSSWVGSTLIAAAGREIWSLETDPPARAKSFLQSDYTLQSPSLSPDGHWLAYVSLETGKSDVYVRSYPQDGETVRVSVTDVGSPWGGGTSPLWTRSGRELVFMREKERDVYQVFAVAVDTSDGFRFEPPQLLFEGRYSETVPAHGYDVSPDGQTFVMVKRGVGEPFVTSMHLVLGWEPEFDNRVRPD